MLLNNKQLIQRQNIKRTFFKPVKERIEMKYGTETASFLLSNRIIDELIAGTNGHLTGYKKRLILETAEELNLKIDKRFGM